MIPGPYSICHGVFEDEASEVPTFKPLKFGYDTAEQAWKNLDAVASEEGVSPEECTVIRVVEREEAKSFNS